MAEITRERREFLAECIDGEPANRNLSGWGIAVSIADIRALLDAADERDRLRAMLFRTMRACEMGRLAGDVWLKEFGFADLVEDWNNAPL